MSLIEKAAQRLEELNPPLPAPVPAPVPKSVAVPQAVAPNDALPSAVPEAVAVPAPPAVTRAPRVEIDLERLAASGMVVPTAPSSHIAEEFRVLKRPLLANSMGITGRPVRRPNLIMVTSALPSEGKSFTSVNLAMSIAMELERTALLVDADVARPSLPGLLGVDPKPGLLDVLMNKDVQLGDVIQRTNVEKLNLVMAGTPHPRATELLASEAMGRLLDEIADRYPDRLVIFDSPPLLVTTQARVLATHMGQIVFVVHAEHTLQAAVKEALAAIESCPVKFAVLNRANQGNAMNYGYGYGYGR